MSTYYVKVRPTNGGQHSTQKSYSFWTTVYDEVTGDSYLSIQDVPAGIAITNTDYWTLYSRNDARYEYLLGLLNNLSGTTATSAEVAALKQQLTSLIAASGETAGNTELQDIRNGADGKVYKTAGEAVRQQLTDKADKDDVMSWSQWFDLHRSGWRGGVTFPRFSVSQSALGTKTGDNANMVAEASTATTVGRNDYADQSNTNLMFNGIDVNGYIDADGEPHITAIEGSADFARDGSNGDVYRAFLTPFYRRIYTDEVDGWEFSDLPAADLKPWAGAVRLDGTYRSFYMIAKYQGSYNEDGVVASISGKVPIRAVSHNSQIAIFQKKGEQYCGFTSDDVAWAQWMFDMKFATRNSASVLAGCISYNSQYAAAIEEDDVARVILTKSQAANYIVGSYVSVGYAGLNNGALSVDRGYSNLHKYADDVRILRIEDYDETHSAIYMDVDTPFSTAEVTVSEGLVSPVYITSMFWWTGCCDGVLGPDGSPSNPTNGKEPFVLSGVEFGLGGYTVLSDVILSGTYDSGADTYSQTPYIVDDNRKISNNKLSDDYVKLGIIIPDTNGAWKYISEQGYDARYPFVTLPAGIGASSSTGYCDAVITGSRVTALREALWFGYLLAGGTIPGLRCLYALSALGSAWWAFLLRLSSLRRGVAA